MLTFSKYFDKFRAICSHLNFSNDISFVFVYVCYNFEFTKLGLENVK